MAPDDMAVVHPHQTDEHTSLVEAFKKLLYLGDENMVGAGIGYPPLLGMGLEITVAYLHADTARHFIGTPQLIGQVLGHGHQGGPQFDHIDGVPSGGALIGYGLALVR